MNLMDPNDLAIFARWLKQRREALDLTQKELATATDCSVSTIRKMEMGLRRPSKQIAELLAMRLEIAPDEQTAFMQFARGNTPSRTRQLSPLPSSATQTLPLPQPTHATQNGAHIAQTAIPSWTATNLPVPLTSFVGRESMIERIRSLLGRVDVRLLTLTGPPGIGKTRLSIEIASALLSDFSDGVFFVSLAPISDPALVLPAIADTIRVPTALRESGLPLSQVLAEHLQHKDLLLVMDNFEQVVDAAEDVAHLLMSAGRLRVLATSRIPLHLSGEQEVAVPPMEMPEESENDVLDDKVEAYEAVQLFTRRAQTANAEFNLKGNVHTVAEICRRLDGLPLAIELAATRAKFHTPQALLSLLQDRLALLTSGPRDLPDRHKTLRAAIAWSYDLLNVEEKRLFQGLGVFSGGCSLRAARAVCEVTGGLEDEGKDNLSDILGKMNALADKSLLSVQSLDLEDESEDVRFTLLETIRDFALECLEESGEADMVRRRHANFFLKLGEEARPQLRGSDQKTWLDRLERDHANLLAALDYLLGKATRDKQASEQSLRLGIAYSAFCYLRGYSAEARKELLRGLQAHERWLTALGQLDNSNDGEMHKQMLLRSNALNELGSISWFQSDLTSARYYYNESLSISKQAGDKLQTAKALNNLGMLATEHSDFAGARLFYMEALQIAEDLDEEAGVARVLNNLGVIAHKEADYAEARRYYEKSLQIRRGIGDLHSVAVTLDNLAWVGRYLDDLPTAIELHQEALQIARELGDKRGISRALIGLGDASLRGEDHLSTNRYYREGLQTSHEIDFGLGIIESIEGLSYLALKKGELSRSARLYGWAEKARETMQITRNAWESAQSAQFIADIKAQIGKDNWESARADGQEMSQESAITFALA